MTEYVLVPREPTEAMFVEGRAQTMRMTRERGSTFGNWLDACELDPIYRAMISTSPAVGVVEALRKIAAHLDGYEYLHSRVRMAALEARQALSSLEKTNER